MWYGINDLDDVILWTLIIGGLITLLGCGGILLWQKLFIDR